MTGQELVEFSREAIVTFFKVGMPVMVIGLLVGVIISLFQALTQIQEQTLTFVPKILILFAVFVVTIPFMSTTLIEFTRELMARAVGIGVGGAG